MIYTIRKYMKYVETCFSLWSTIYVFKDKLSFMKFIVKRKKYLNPSEFGLSVTTAALYLSIEHTLEPRARNLLMSCLMLSKFHRIMIRTKCLNYKINRYSEVCKKVS